MSSPIVVVVVFLSSVLSFSQSAQTPTGDQPTLIASAQTIAIAAVTFREGDAAQFNLAQPSFTSEGWSDFLKHMNGYLDHGGAPTYTSSFVATHAARFLGERDGVLVLRIPGTLTQRNKLGQTTYQAALEVHAIRDGDSTAGVRLQRLEQITCVGTSAACQ